MKEQSSVHPEDGRAPSLATSLEKATEAKQTTPSTGSANPELKVSSKPEEPQYSQGIINVVMFANFLVMFLMSLDRTIIATAIPTITNHFNSLSDVGWYGSAYLITMCGFQLVLGRVYTFYNTKVVYLVSIGIFELGSLICGVAPSSVCLIVGRAIAGLGSCGIMSGAIVLIVQVIPLPKRPAYMGVFGMVSGVSSVAGPLIGGAFTSKVSWRWCFYINLPCGAVTAAIILFILKLPPPPVQKKLSLRQKIDRLDPIGTVIFLPSVVCLLLALQKGGTAWSWSSARIIVLLVLSGLGGVTFIAIQIWRGENATVPPRIFTFCRTIPAGFAYSFCSDGTMQPIVYFLPIWFQAIKGASAVKSGIMNIPLVLSVVIASLLAGFLTRKIGYYVPFVYFTALVAPIGAGLLTTFTTTTNHSKWIGYQVICGLALGAGTQQTSVACQTVLDKKDVPTGASLMLFARTLGGAIFISVANNIFDNKLATGIAEANIPGVSAELVANIGVTDLRKVIPAESLPAVLVVYNMAVRNAFYVALALSCCLIVGASFMEWKSVRGPPKNGNQSSNSNSNSNNQGLPEKKDEEIAIPSSSSSSHNSETVGLPDKIHKEPGTV